MTPTGPCASPADVTTRAAIQHSAIEWPMLGPDPPDLPPGLNDHRLRSMQPLTDGPMTGPRHGRRFTVAVIDDQPVTRAGMEMMAADDPQLKVVASTAHIDELDDGAGSPKYDVAVLALPAQVDGPSVDAIARAARLGRLIITSTWEQPPTVLAAVQSGARGCLTRRSEQEAVADALHVVAHGGFYLCAGLVDRFYTELSSPRQDDPTGLAPREIETLRWIALGFTQSQIASRMGLSPATVNTYAKRIRNKLSAGNKAELTRMAIELGYLGNDRRHPLT